MKRAITTLTLSRERGEQLRQIAAVKDVPLSELIAQFVRSEIKRGTIPDEIPGYGVRRSRGRIELSIRGKAFSLKPAQAIELAKALTEVACFTSRSAVWETYPWLLVETVSDDFFNVRRRGKGIILEAISRGKKLIKTTLSPDLAVDLARHLSGGARR